MGGNAAAACIAAFALIREDEGEVNGRGQVRVTTSRKLLRGRQAKAATHAAL
jgi:hypothetical protein